MDNIFDLSLTKDYSDEELDNLIKFKFKEWVDNWDKKELDLNDLMNDIHEIIDQ